MTCSLVIVPQLVLCARSPLGSCGKFLLEYEPRGLSVLHFWCKSTTTLLYLHASHAKTMGEPLAYVHISPETGRQRAIFTVVMILL